LPSTGRPKQLALVADTIRGHRLGLALWASAGAASMYGIAIVLVREFSTYPGGAKGLAPTVEAAAQALRVLRWPAERLDTLGGYLTYHNIVLLPLLLGIYCAIQGAQAVRGAELRGSLEGILATGFSRRALVLERAVGFLVVLVGITVAIGLGVAAGLAAGGEADTWGALVATGEAVLCSFTFYALGMLVSQFTRSARTAAGITSMVMAFLYVYTNVWDQAGPFAAARFISPFFYFQQSRVLVPGHGFDPVATLILVALPTVLLIAAAMAFEGRDYASKLWARKARPVKARSVAVQRLWLRTWWSAGLVRERLSLLAWSVGAATFAALVSTLEPTVREMWNKLEFIQVFLAQAPGATPTDQYIGFAGATLAPLAAAYAATHVASWVGDLKQGRVELVLSSPMSWARLVGERLVGLVVGVTVVTAAALLGLAAGALAVGAALRPDGLLRVAADAILFGLAIGAVGAALVAWLRNGAAPALLALFIAASYFLDLFAPAFALPSWVGRLSVFNSFGQPYLGMPELAGLVYLVGLAGLGTIVAVAVSQRSPKVA
jgi:ABC-2 type transport system permease protein